MSEHRVPVARSSDVTTVPRPVEVAGRPCVAVRLGPAEPATVVAALCPHRLVPLEELDAGSVKTIVFLMLPETGTSTRIHTKMLLHNIGGELRPAPGTVACEVAFEAVVLAEDLRLQAVVTVPGLPLDMRTELHVRADRLGVSLRRELTASLIGQLGRPRCDDAREA